MLKEPFVCMGKELSFKQYLRLLSLVCGDRLIDILGRKQLDSIYYKAYGDELVGTFTFIEVNDLMYFIRSLKEKGIEEEYINCLKRYVIADYFDVYSKETYSKRRRCYTLANSLKPFFDVESRLIESIKDEETYDDVVEVYDGLTAWLKNHVFVDRRKNSIVTFGSTYFPDMVNRGYISSVNRGKTFNNGIESYPLAVTEFGDLNLYEVKQFLKMFVDVQLSNIEKMEKRTLLDMGDFCVGSYRGFLHSEIDGISKIPSYREYYG